jgi:iron(III) transport system permease protein
VTQRRLFATQPLPVLAAGAALLLILGYLVVVPLAMLVVSAFKPNGFPLEPGFTTAHVAKAFADPFLPGLILNTLAFSAGSTVLAVGIGLALAFLLERTDLPLRGLWRGTVVMAMAIPPLLLAIAWTLLLSPRIGAINVVVGGWLGTRQPIFDIYSLGGMIFVEGLALVPSAYLMLAAPVANIGQSLDEAASMSGAGPLRRLLRIHLPMLLPAIASAALVLFIIGLVIFDVPAIIGIPAKLWVFSTHLYNLANNPPDSIPLYGEIGALSFLLLLALGALVLLVQRLGRDAQRFVAITGKAWRAPPARLGAWRWPLAGLVGLYLLLAVLLPFAMLLWTSLLPYQARFSLNLVELLTTENHLTFLRNARALEATSNAMQVALISATGVVLLAFAVATYVHRTKGPGRRIIDTLALVPLALPGVMVGLALVFVYLSLDFLPVYGTIWIIVIAFVTDYVAYGSRSMGAVMVQLHPELEEAARMSGAGPARILRRILVPLFLPAALAVWIWVFAHALRALSTPIMLQGRDNVVLSTLLWGYWNSGEPTIAAAIGVWLVGILAIATVAWRATARKGAIGAV